MSSPAANRPGPFVNRLVGYVLPYFLAVTSDQAQAEAEVLETLASYGARTRSELVKAVQIIAFSFSALEVLAGAKMAKDLPHPVRLRFLGCANALNRHSEQSEKTLEKRLECDLPDPGKSRADTDMSLQQARDLITVYRKRLPPTYPAITPHETRRPVSPVMQAILDGGIPGRATATG
jgi:hypothetical protein